MRLHTDSDTSLVSLWVFRILVVGYRFGLHILWSSWDLEVCVIVHDGVWIQSGVGSLDWPVVRPHDWEVAVDIFAAVASCHGHYGQ